LRGFAHQYVPKPSSNAHHRPQRSASIHGVADEPGGGRGVYSIGAVARMLGIPVATIRNWEERYGRVVPERSPGGHRLYSRDEVEQLRLVAARVSGGLSAADAHRLLAAPGQDDQLAAEHGASPRPRTLVLVAERDPVGADLARFFLRREGYEVVVALTAGVAEELWLESRPDVVIVELMISGGRGADLCRHLKRQGAGAVLAVSVLEARDEALVAGADAFLRKPFDPLDLVSTVHDLHAADAPIRRGALEAS
jgi:CheY-like chemotaxis protein